VLIIVWRGPPILLPA
jgi:hypothetical protein